MNLKKWLNEERGRCTALAAELGVTVGRISQMADTGVPTKHMMTVRAFTKDSVSLESMVQDRTTPASPDAITDQDAAKNSTPIDLEHSDQERREINDRRKEEERRIAARRADELAAEKTGKKGA